MTSKQETKLVALVGINIGERRFEAGERIDAELTKAQHKWLLGDGYAEEVDKGQRIPSEVKEAIETGAATPNPVEAVVETREAGEAKEEPPEAKDEAAATEEQEQEGTDATATRE